jgi:hypothetical protein
MQPRWRYTHLNYRRRDGGRIFLAIRVVRLFFRAKSPTQMAMRRSRLCIRIISLIAAYAIALHGFLLALTGLPATAGARADPSAPSFELCLHQASAALPEAPDAPSSNDAHCTFCIGQTHSPFVAPNLSGVLFIFRTRGEPIWLVLNQDQSGFSRYFHKQPRGPPAAV